MMPKSFLETSRPSATRSCPWAAVVAVGPEVAAAAGELPSGTAAVAGPVAGTGSAAALDIPCTVAAEVVAAVAAAQIPAAGPGSQ